MSSKTLTRKIRKLEARLVRQHQKLGELKRRRPPEPVANYTLAGPTGPVKLSALFGSHKDLIVVHNMGRRCPYCTMWADGYNGLRPHLENRAAFAVVSPDSVKVQQAFAQSRGWKFRMLSGKDSVFAADMGFMDGRQPLPGVSTFRRKGNKIYRIASAPFGPYDPFCATWHFFDLLADGVGDWSPKFQY
jgi:predicted dithiol-disulfide oxidoreductase (DUF899 family)